MGKHPFTGFTRGDFAQTARTFWNNGYRSVDQVRDMDPKERDLFLQETKRDNRGGRSTLSDLRLTLKIFSWFEPNGRGRADNIPFNEVCIGERMKKWTMNLSRIGACIEPDQDMVNFFSAQLEVGRTARPPMSPYVTADSLATYPWLPADDPHAKALVKWRNGQKPPNRFTGDQDLSPSQYVLYRMRFVLAGDLTDAWADFGGLVAQLNLIALVTDMAITDHPGIAITYDRRIHRHIQKLAQKRVSSTDYFSILSVMQPDIKAAVIRDFEYNTGLIKKEKETEKAKKAKTDTNTDNKNAGKKGKKWSDDDWAAWKKAQRAKQAATKEEKTDQTTEKTTKPDKK